MSYKSIELQVAVPRTYEAGRLQEQLSKKPMIDQDQNSSAQLMTDTENRHKPSGTSEADSSKLKYPQERNSHQQHSQHQPKDKKEERKEAEKSTHPFKGKNIDLSL